MPKTKETNPLWSPFSQKHFDLYKERLGIKPLVDYGKSGAVFNQMAKLFEQYKIDPMEYLEFVFKHFTTQELEINSILRISSLQKYQRLKIGQQREERKRGDLKYSDEELIDFENDIKAYGLNKELRNAPEYYGRILNGDIVLNSIVGATRPLTIQYFEDQGVIVKRSDGEWCLVGDKDQKGNLIVAGKAEIYLDKFRQLRDMRQKNHINSTQSFREFVQIKKKLIQTYD